MSKIDNLMDQFNAAEKQIFEHFQAVQQWRYYPIEDMRDVYWTCDLNKVIFHKDKGEVESYLADEGENVYSGVIVDTFTTDSHTMIFLDTETDHNVFAAVFDNDREI